MLRELLTFFFLGGVLLLFPVELFSCLDIFGTVAFLAFDFRPLGAFCFPVLRSPPARPPPRFVFPRPRPKGLGGLGARSVGVSLPPPGRFRIDSTKSELRGLGLLCFDCDYASDL